MVLYFAYLDAGQFIACMCQIWLVYVSLRKRYVSTLSYFWLALVYSIKGQIKILAIYKLFYSKPVQEKCN